MKVLTIKQPWLWCITDGTKRIENRSWFPWVRQVGATIYLHAAKKDDKAAYSELDGMGISVPKDIPRGCIVATCKIADVFSDPELLSIDDRKWFKGPFGWKLANIEKLDEPIYCKGQLGLWNYNGAING